MVRIAISYSEIYTKVQRALLCEQCSQINTDCSHHIRSVKRNHCEFTCIVNITLFISQILDAENET